MRSTPELSEPRSGFGLNENVSLYQPLRANSYRQNQAELQSGFGFNEVLDGRPVIVPHGLWGLNRRNNASILILPQAVKGL